MKGKIEDAVEEASLLLLIHCHKEFVSERQILDCVWTSPKSLYQPLLQRNALRLPGFRKSCGEYLNHLDPHVPAFLYQTGDFRTGDTANDVIHRAWDVVQTNVDRQASDLSTPGIHHIQRALITTLDKGGDVILF